MADFGSAPRKVGNVWVTRTGRRLSPEGQVFWNKLHKQGRTDGFGHMAAPDKQPDTSFGIGRAKAVIRGEAHPHAGGGLSDIKKVGKALGKGVIHATGIDTVVSDIAHPQQAGRRQSHGLGRSTSKGATDAARVLPKTARGASNVAFGKDLTAAALGEKHGKVGLGLDAAALLPFGRGAKLIKSVKAAEDAAHAAPTAEQAVRATAKSSEKAYAEQEALRSAERAKRFGKMSPAYEAAGGGRAGVYAKKRELKGELPKVVHFGELSKTSEEDMNKLLNHVEYGQHDLQEAEKMKLQDALLNAKEGILMRPHERKYAERVFGKDAADQIKIRNKFSRHVTNALMEVLNIPRSVASTLDLSINGRQLLLAIAHNPKIVAKNFPKQIKAMGSEKYHIAEQARITSHPRYEQWVKDGLHVTNDDLHNRTEMFGSNIAEKMTGIKKLPSGVPGKYGPIRASSRSFTTGQNGVRFDMANSMLDDALKKGYKNTLHLRQSIARFSNEATGRGRLPGGLEKIAPELNVPFFAPRLTMSRINSLANLKYYKDLHPYVRVKAIKAMSKLLAAGGGLGAALAYGAGAKVSLDPTNADFGKVRFGDTRFDVWGGFQQPVRLEEQLRQKKITSSTSGKQIALSGTKFGGLSRLTVAGRFLRGKESPGFSFLHDAFQGNNFQGQPFSLKNEIKSRSYPLLAGDVVDTYHRNHSIGKTVATGAAGALGVGVQSYGPKRNKQNGRFVSGKSDPNLPSWAHTSKSNSDLPSWAR